MSEGPTIQVFNDGIVTADVQDPPCERCNNSSFYQDIKETNVVRLANFDKLHYGCRMVLDSGWYQTIDRLSSDHRMATRKSVYPVNILQLPIDDQTSLLKYFTYTESDDVNIKVKIVFLYLKLKEFFLS